MPMQSKIAAIDRIIMGFIQELQRCAGQGKTSYMYVHENTPEKITKEDLIHRFQEKFPDCLVYYSYEEVWVEQSNGRTEMKNPKKGIVIDWS